MARHSILTNSAFTAFGKVLCLVICLFASELFAGITQYGTYAFQRNKERPKRSETRYIILHTTEGAAKGSGEKLQRNGEAHYMIDTAGNIFVIVDIRRVAYHCGLSMWNGRSNLDTCSIGIEMVGYHNRNLTAAQIKSLRELIKEIRQKYRGISDDRVLTHSMVAYGAPNQWHRRPHRGRKRCGMRMAITSVRNQLGLKTKPAYDPDVRAGRLIVADKQLFSLLYKKTLSVAEENKVVENYAKDDNNNVISSTHSAWDIARDLYNTSSVTYIFPDGTKKTGNKISDWKSMPRGTKVIVSSETTSINESAKKSIEKDSKSKKPDGKDKKSDISNKKADGKDKKTDNKDISPDGNGKKPEVKEPSVKPKEKQDDNVIGPRRSAWDIAKNAYNAASTVYIFPDGTRKTGSEITDWKNIKAGTKVIVASLDNNTDTNGVITAATVAMTGEAAKNLLKSITGDSWSGTNTFYLPPSGKYYRGSDLTAEKFGEFEEGTKVLSGYRIGGPVSATLPLYNICGEAWNKPTTYYLFPNGTVLSGDKVNASKIPLNTMVFIKE